MLIHVGDARRGSIDLALAAVMSAVAGALNAVGFQVVGLFSANMTGNVSALADHLANRDLRGAIDFAGLVVMFVTGAALSAGLIYWGEARRLRSIYALVVMIEAALLLCLWTMVGPDLKGVNGMVLVTALSFLMGLQNAATTLISQARVRTTHVSGMATDLGIEAAAMFAGSEARRIALPNLILHGATILCFALGGVAGAIIYALWGTVLFPIVAAVLFALAVPETILSLWRET